MDADGRWAKTEYTAPEAGLPTATAADPGGLNLRTTTVVGTDSPSDPGPWNAVGYGFEATSTALEPVAVFVGAHRQDGA